MSLHTPAFLRSVFRVLIGLRWWIVVAYALLLVPAAYFAMRVPQDNSTDRLIVQTDPDYVTAKQFGEVFGTGDYVVLLAEAPDPFAPAVLARVADLETRLAALPKVSANSLLSVYRRVHPDWKPDAAGAAALRAFATGTDLFHKQNLFGDHYLIVALVLDVHDSAERYAMLATLDTTLAPFERDLAPLEALRKVGQPYVNAYLDQSSRSANLRLFPLFVGFVVALVLLLYRSPRTLLAFVASLGVNAALTVGFVGATHGVFTIVSALVPMTVLITCMATLVYIHSRFVEQPAGTERLDHHVEALANKFLPCTASVFATAAGFAALVVSKIRPIRELGLWVAVGLLFTWVVVFTLFPALQAILRTPTRIVPAPGAAAGPPGPFERFTARLPALSYRYRYALVGASLALCAVGAVALFGIPGVLEPMHLETKQIEYINHSSTLYRDTRKLESEIGGLSITEMWVKGPGQLGAVTEPAVILGLQHFAADVEKAKHVSAVVGLPTLLRTLRYVGGKGDQLPADPDELEELAGSVETMMASEPTLARFVDKQLTQTHLAVISETLDYEGFVALEKEIAARWQAARARDPALARFEVRTTGMAQLQAKISYHLVPTLTESFVLSAGIIFAAFLVLFRNGAARIMAMIPSLFAILVMFATMRALGMTLNVATILIASTVLGTSENDQVHFFYHFQEEEGRTTEQRMRHTLHIAGRAILFATLINAGGFLAFALADLPPIRQFGILSSLAFLLSMIADFTALPAALWLVFRQKPDAA